VFSIFLNPAQGIKIQFNLFKVEFVIDWNLTHQQLNRGYNKISKTCLEEIKNWGKKFID